MQRAVPTRDLPNETDDETSAQIKVCGDVYRSSRTQSQEGRFFLWMRPKGSGEQGQAISSSDVETP